MLTFNWLNKRRMQLLAGLLLGALMIAGGWNLAKWKDEQTLAYDLGLAYYQAGDLPKAVFQYDKSISEYKKALRYPYWQRLAFPQAKTELAALAAFQKGKTLIRAQQLEQAVAAFKDSLAFNPGDGYSENLSKADRDRMHEEAMTVKYDLELLFKNNKDLAQKEGKGKPKDGQGKGNKPVPGNDPGKLPGKGNRDDI
jgi:tetratricopeptide (TPR) repeat protein